MMMVDQSLSQGAVMAEVVLILGLIFSLTGCVLLWRGWHHLLNRHLLRAGAHGGVGLSLLTAASITGFATLNQIPDRTNPLIPKKKVNI